MKRWLGWLGLVALAVVACKESAPTAEGQVAPAEGAKTGEKKSDKQFTIEIKADEVKSGEKGTAKVVIKAAKGYHWNENYPAAFKISTTPAPVKIEKTDFDASAFQAKKEGPEATLDVPFAGASAGAGEVKATASFSVCNDEACLVYRNEQVAFTVTVK